MITLVLGGARSGKSAVAERLAARTGEAVTYVATAFAGHDPDLDARIAAHRARRPPAWATVEAGHDLAAIISALAGTVLVDSLGPWLAAQPAMAPDETRLCRALVDRAGHTIVVSDEVGLGVHPSSAQGRAFRDSLGSLNQSVAEVADSVLLVVAGCTLALSAGDP